MTDESELVPLEELSHLEVLLPLSCHLALEVGLVALVLSKLGLLQSVLLPQELNLALLVVEYGLQLLNDRLLEVVSVLEALLSL